MSPNDEDLRADNKRTDCDSSSGCQDSQLYGDSGLAQSTAWIAHILFRQKGELWDLSFLPLLGIASRVVALHLGWLQGIKFKAVLRGVIGEKRERVDGRKLAICTGSFPKNDWKAETRLHPSQMTPSVRTPLL